MTLLNTFSEEEKEALQQHELKVDCPSQLSDSFVLGMRHQKKQPISFEDFVVQHDGIQLIMEEYGLKVDLIKQSFEKELISLIELSEYSRKLEKL